MSAMTEQAARTGEPFAFTESNLERARDIVARYPEGKQRSALLPMLDLAQRQHGGWLSQEALDYVAEFLDLPPIKVYEVATFYSMYNLQPIGRYFIQVCRTSPCWLRGSDAITKACMEKLGVGLGETTSDRMFTLVEVECLGACVNAPMVQINDDYYEDLDAQKMSGLIDDLASGREVTIGSQSGRQASAPAQVNSQAQG